VLRTACRIATAIIVAAWMTAVHGVTLPPGFQQHLVLGPDDGLVDPVAVRVAPHGRIFVAEKSGLVVAFDGRDDGEPDVVLDIRQAVHDYLDRGLLGLALDPLFPERPWLYVFYTLNHDPHDPGSHVPYWPDGCPIPLDGCVVNARVSRLAVSPENQSVGGEHVLAENRWCQQFSSHSVGSIVFRADGALCLGSGDGASFSAVDYGQFGGTEDGPVRSRRSTRTRTAARRRRTATRSGAPGAAGRRSAD
jgi:glucose/arabinose dehydrogenase